MNSLQRVIDPLSGPVQPRNRRRNPLWRFRRFFFVIALFALGALGAVLFAFSQTELPEDHFDEIAQTSFLCTAEVTQDCGPDNATAMLSAAGEDREVVTYDQLPPQLVQAVVATEDQSFFSHQGIDPKGIARAAFQYLRQQGVTQGGSTITQQYVKLAFNDQDRTLTRKAREAIRAIKLEEELAEECAASPDLGDKDKDLCAKEEILTRYLNRAYFGRGASGVQAAARSYFGKDVGELTVAESAYLAGLLRNPSGAEPETDPEEANRRRSTSIQLMLDQEFITAEEAAAANAEPWNIVPRRDREGLGEVKGAEVGSEYFVEEVRQQLDALYPNGEVYTSGLRVYTTLHPDLQAAAYQAAHAPKEEDLDARGLAQMGPTYLDPNNPADPSAAIVSVDGEGRVVAMLGGTNFDETEFNLATSSGGQGRQPGSTFKPLGLVTAIEQGISPLSLYPAVPGVTEVGGPCVDAQGEDWKVTGGASAKYRYRDLVDALTYSSNVVFAELVVDIGPEQLRTTAGRMGVTSFEEPPTEPVPCSIILGSQGVPVLEMASVYSTLERAGVRLDPVLIERVENVDGEIICWFPVDGVCAPGPARQGEQVIDPTVARNVNYIMTEVVNTGTGKRALFGDRPIAGKTGTSQENRDGWFAGFSCDLTTVVWMGHPGEEETPMVDFRKPVPEDGSNLDANGELIDDPNWPNVEGGNFPSMIWSHYMAAATAAAPPCEGLEVDANFSGAVLNEELSVTTLPPCGVELDANGFPKGSGPDDFIFLPSTTVPPSTEPESPDTGSPDSSQPAGLRYQEGDTSTSQPDCLPLDEWIRQQGGNPASPTTVDPNVDDGSSSSTEPGDPTTEPSDPNGGDGGDGTDGTQPTEPPTTDSPDPTEPTEPSEPPQPSVAPPETPPEEEPPPNSAGEAE